MNNSSLKTDRHQAIQIFFDSLPTRPSPEVFNKILSEAASSGLRIIAKIPEAVFKSMVERFGSEAWVIQNFPTDQIPARYYIYNGKTWLGREKSRTFQTLTWQVFDYLKKMRQNIAAKQEYLKKRESHYKELNAIYNEMLTKMQAEISDADLINILNILEQKNVIKKVSEEEKENPDIFYFHFRARKKNEDDNSLEWVHLFYQYNGPRDHYCLERQIYNDLRKFKRMLLEKIRQKSEKIRQERIQRQSGFNQQASHTRPHHIETGGSKKCIKAMHYLLNVEGGFGEKNKWQRKWEKKLRKKQRQKQKNENLMQKYYEELDSFDGD